MITQERLKELLEYNPYTGIFTSKKTNIAVGYKVGSKNKYYLGYEAKGKQYKLHRLAWLYVNGSHPLGMIDHIDGDTFNNKIENLRIVNRSENAQNQKKAMKTNKSSGLLGVYYRKDRCTFRAIITVNKKRINLGYFANKEDAHDAYLTAKRKLHPACTI